MLLPKRFPVPLLVVFFLFNLTPYVYAAEERVEVVTAESGVTMKLVDGRIVRLIGLKTSDAYAETARAFMAKMVNGKTVLLEFDNTFAPMRHKDPAGNLLAYVYDGEGVGKLFQGIASGLTGAYYEKRSDGLYYLSMNQTMLKLGFAGLDPAYPFSRSEDFSKLEAEAKKHHREMWRA